LPAIVDVAAGAFLRARAGAGFRGAAALAFLAPDLAAGAGFLAAFARVADVFLAAFFLVRALRAAPRRTGLAALRAVFFALFFPFAFFAMCEPLRAAIQLRTVLSLIERGRP
jgi:hypothetical protein